MRLSSGRIVSAKSMPSAKSHFSCNSCRLDNPSSASFSTCFSHKWARVNEAGKLAMKQLLLPKSNDRLRSLRGNCAAKILSTDSMMSSTSRDVKLGAASAKNNHVDDDMSQFSVCKWG